MINGNEVRIYIDNEEVLTAQKGVRIIDLVDLLEPDRKEEILVAKVNNRIRDLNYQIYVDSDVEFIDLSVRDGEIVYKRSLFLVLLYAVNELYNDLELSVRHSLGRGTYCELEGEREISENDVKRIEEKMTEIINQNKPLEFNEYETEYAERFFKENGETDKVDLLKYSSIEKTVTYNIDGKAWFLYGALVLNTSYLKKFRLVYYPPGFVLMYADRYSVDKVPEFKESKQLFNVFSEYKDWGKILNVSNVGELNKMIATDHAKDMILISESLHEKKISNIADMIYKRKDEVRVVLIAGPSSSGKTTFSKRLAIHLRVNGLKPTNISLDDYYLPKNQVPLDDCGEIDLETVDALDIELFNNHLKSLISGDEVEIPLFSFIKGRREDFGRKLKLDNDEIIIIEGIHGLNEKLTYLIPHKNKFKIYISDLTQLSLDGYNPISTTDTRLIRRIVRDAKYRSSSAVETLSMWRSVRKGENKYIFPFQEQADIMFNSALVYELAVLKDYAIPLLEEIDYENKYYSEAVRLKDFLKFFLSIPSKYTIPYTSILREFIGASIFE